MRKLILLTVVVLSGCADPAKIQQAVEHASNSELCLGLVKYPRISDAILGELARRGENCQQYAALMQAQAQALQAQAARDAAAVDLFRALQPRPQTNCTSRVYGNTVQTNCN